MGRLLSIACLLIVWGCGKPSKTTAAVPAAPTPALVMPPAVQLSTERMVMSASVSSTGKVGFLTRLHYEHHGGKDVRIFDDLESNTSFDSQLPATNNIVLSHNGKWVAIDEQGHTGPSQVFLFRDGKRRHILNGAEDYASCHFVSGDRKLFATSFGIVLAWDVASGKKLSERIIGTDKFQDWAEMVPASEGKLVQASADIWSVRPFQKLVPLKRAEGVEVSSVVENEKLTLLRAENANLVKSEAKTGKVLGTATGVWEILGFSPDGSLFWTRSPDKDSVAIYSTSTLKQLSRISLNWDIRQESKLLNNNVFFVPGTTALLFEVSTGKLALKVIPILDVSKAKGAEDPWLAVLPTGQYTGSGCDEYVKSRMKGAVRDKKAVAEIWSRLFVKSPNVD